MEAGIFILEIRARDHSLTNTSVFEINYLINVIFSKIVEFDFIRKINEGVHCLVQIKIYLYIERDYIVLKV